jgi:hypothetical protein
VALVLRHRHCRVISYSEIKRFGTWSRCAYDDVGVCFGGSEHHRIGVSSSHTRHPARESASQPPGQGNRRCLISFERSVLRDRATHLFGGRATWFHLARPPGAPRSLGGGSRNRLGNERVLRTAAALFGAMCADQRGGAPPLGAGTGTLRSAAPVFGSDPSNRATGHRAPRGRAAGRSRAGPARVYTTPPRWRCGRQDHRCKPGVRPGRTVTAGRQRPVVMRVRLLMRESLRRV